MLFRLLFALILCWVPLAAVANEPIVYVIPLKEQVSDAQFAFLRRSLKEAKEQNAQAIILDMDTPGGSLNATVKIKDALASTGGRTITWINPNAASAGALIAISTQEIYMAPVAAVGAAAPVSSGGENLPQTIMEKSVSYYSSIFSSVAESNGHNPAIARAFIDKDVEVKIGDDIVHAKGSILTLNTQQATKLYDGKPLFAKGSAATLEELLEKAGLQGADVRHATPTGFELAAFWITTLAPLMLMGGIIGAWIEIKTPGFGLPGILSATCFTIFFLGHYVAGLAGWEAPVLFALGALLIILELVLIPGIFILAGTGLAIMLGVLIWTMVDHYPGQPIITSFGDLLFIPMLNLFIAVLAACVIMAFLAKYLPKTSLYQKLILSTHIPVGPSFVPNHNEFANLPVGAEGVACSILRPSGRANFEGKPRDVISTGEFVEAGTPIRVVSVEGSRIVVEPIPSAAQQG